tara:strand:+ start:97741 stop:99684 length:1944 start_codon:yes stop_codon:yes gene_type:complete
MIVEPLILDPVEEPLWDNFQTGQALSPGTPLTVEHWQRSRQLGANPEGVLPEDALSRGSEISHRQERLEALLHCGQPALERASAVAARQDYCLLLSDPDGFVVHVDAGGAFRDAAYRARLMVGADWSEATRGTNAIGTALATRRPVFVSGRAHYARANHQLVCYAAPIFDVGGELVAVLDVTSTSENADPSMGMGVVASAQALQDLLRVQAYSQAGATVTRALARSLERMDCPVAVVEAPGRIARMNGPARALLGVDGGNCVAKDVLGADFAALTRLALSEQSARMCSPITGSAYTMHLEAIESEGRVLALMAFLEPIVPAAKPRLARRVRAGDDQNFASLFRQDQGVQAALSRAGQVARSNVPVMLLAETGAGKELVARGVHQASLRAKAPFVAINCGAIAPTLLESELFGYGPGAFTGADKNGRGGLLQSAAGGTLFLDEVAEMSQAMQASLLRFVESGTFYRVGEHKARNADVRIVCATCKDLASMVREGRFRSDLYYRLKGATVTLPALRERTDVVPLAEHLLRAMAEQQKLSRLPTISKDAAEALRRYPWPGNVRELKSTLEVALVLAGDDGHISLEHLSPEIAEAGESPSKKKTSQSLAGIKESQIRRVLSEVGGNVSRAANRLGVARSTLYRMMRRYGVR